MFEGDEVDFKADQLFLSSLRKLFNDCIRF